jgi:hypothetical protein
MENKDFVPHQESFELKELGFDEPCFGYHLCKNSVLGVYLEITTEWIDLIPYDSSSCKAPTFSRVFRWFREKHQLHPTITSISQESWQWHIQKPGESLGRLYDEDFYTYEEAELECLRKLIEIVKNK